MNPTFMSIAAAAMCLAVVPLHSTPLAAEPSEAERASGSRALVKAFATNLKSALIGAMKSDGPVSAIAVCSSVAPAIAKERADEAGWSVGRTALKLRNPRNAPDDWERAVLEQFLGKTAGGAVPGKLEHYETTTLQGKRVFRYMKAIATEQPCLTCHGSDVKADVLKAIKQFYPDDRAIGFKLGELRGAFTIVQPLD